MKLKKKKYIPEHKQWFSLPPSVKFIVVFQELFLVSGLVDSL